MVSKEYLYDFLKANGFVLTQSELSQSFGDYYDIFTSEHIQLRYVSDRSIESVDIRRDQPNESWFDLVLVMALFSVEAILNKVIAIEEQMEFILKELAKIADLFSDENYPSTKRKLEELRNERAKQIRKTLQQRF